jgi:hypothetical protein
MIYIGILVFLAVAAILLLKNMGGKTTDEEKAKGYVKALNLIPMACYAIMIISTFETSMKVRIIQFSL